MYLITGATGRLGRLVVEQTLARVGTNSVAIGTRRPVEDLAALGVTVRHADYDDAESLVPALTGVERLLLVSSSANPHELRLEHHARVIGAASQVGVHHLVYTSLFAGAPASIGEVHRRTEDLLRSSGLSFTVLRHPLYTDNFLTGVLADPDLVSATANAPIGTATRADLAEAAAVALTSTAHDGRVYNLTGPLWTFDELAAELTAHSGKAFTHRQVGVGEFAEILTGEGVSGPLHGILCDIQAAIAAGGLSTGYPDLATLLSRRPTDLATAVRTLAD